MSGVPMLHGGASVTTTGTSHSVGIRTRRSPDGACVFCASMADVFEWDRALDDLRARFRTALGVVACTGSGAGDIGSRLFRIRSNDRASGAVDGRCVSPALTVHAQLSSGPTAMLASTGLSAGSLAVITLKL